MPNAAPDFKKARKNMVDCQIHTSGVVHTGLLQSFETVPREDFVPANLKSVAYFDEQIEFGKGRFLLEPLTLSKMLEALNLETNDVVLDIGGATGYCAAVISPIVQTIIALESDEAFIKVAEKNWQALDACNVVSVQGTLKDGAADKGPYDVIMMHGAMPEIPTSITAQLNEGGRMACILKKPGDKLGKATLVTALGANQFSSYTLFECAADYVPGFTPKPAFSF